MLTRVIRKALEKKLGCRKVGKIEPAPGVLNQCFVCDTNQGAYFVKTTDADNIEMYAAEAYCLEVIDSTETVKVPRPCYYGYLEGVCFLIMEYLELHPHTPRTQQVLGIQLATMHRVKGPQKFGFEIDNTIGTTFQSNAWHDDWIEFFQTQRLEYQLRLVKEKHNDQEIISYGNTLMDRIPSFFEGIDILPSLLHGDLWGGNSAVDAMGNPVIFDPASYYGHHEAELSIASMFGGFTHDFYEAYHSIIPKENGFDKRQQIYQLYHFLNHYNIFGSAYRNSCLSILLTLLR